MLSRQRDWKGTLDSISERRHGDGVCVGAIRYLKKRIMPLRIEHNYSFLLRNLRMENRWPSAVICYCQRPLLICLSLSCAEQSTMHLVLQWHLSSIPVEENYTAESLHHTNVRFIAILSPVSVPTSRFISITIIRRGLYTYSRGCSRSCCASTCVV
jgi:hypothetical protein